MCVLREVFVPVLFRGEVFVTVLSAGGFCNSFCQEAIKNASAPWALRGRRSRNSLTSLDSLSSLAFTW